MEDCSSHGQALNSTLSKFQKFYKDHVTQDELMDGYGEWADEYDKEYEILHHRGPVILREAVEGLHSPKERPTLTVLDVATGTGRIAQQMKDLGYVTIDGLDGSAGMVEFARKKKIFRNLFVRRITGEHLDLSAESYDVVTCGGAFATNHLPGVAIHEFIRLTKPGGYIVTVSSKRAWDIVPDFHNNLASIIRAYEEDGTVKIVRWETKDEYVVLKNTGRDKAMLIVLQKKM